MDVEAKERLIEEFRACLEDWEGEADTLANDDPQEPSVNLALLFSELAVLRNEVRVQARQYKAALDEMHSLTELLGEQNRRLGLDLERAREAQGTAHSQAERPVLLEMIDVRDRLAAAVEVFNAYQPGFFARLAPAQTKLVQGLGEGLVLTLRRLDDALLRRSVRPIVAIGGRFDHNTMQVVGVESVTGRGAGEVVSEARRGYLCGDELLRLAEVIVNKQEIQA